VTQFQTHKSIYLYEKPKNTKKTAEEFQERQQIYEREKMRRHTQKREESKKRQMEDCTFQPICDTEDKHGREAKR
jgi:predicted transposase YbfD/YdcC